MNFLLDTEPLGDVRLFKSGGIPLDRSERPDRWPEYGVSAVDMPRQTICPKAFRKFHGWMAAPGLNLIGCAMIPQMYWVSFS
jgi:hypothetical protein